KPQRRCEMRMRFTEIRVELQRHPCSRFGFMERIVRWQIAVPSEQHVGIGQTSVGESVGGVLLDRLLKILDRLVKSFFGPSVPVMTTFQIDAVSFGIFGVASGEPLFLRPG